MCPECRSIEDKNWSRHLDTHFDSSVVKEAKEKIKVMKEASRRTAQGLRMANLDFLPQAWKEQLDKDPLSKVQFQLFLDDIGAILPKVNVS